YIISAVGLLVTEGKDVFAMRKADIEKAAANIIALSKDEDALKSVAIRSTNLLEKRLKVDAQSQERVRDAIRSETIANEFRNMILKQSIKLAVQYRI